MSIEVPSQLNSADALSKPRLDRKVFGISAIIVFVVSLTLTLYPQNSAECAQNAIRWITDRFGWFYRIISFVPVLFCAWLAFGRYGQIKLGAADEEPEYSTVSWVAMLFTAGIGASLIAWGFAVPII